MPPPPTPPHHRPITITKADVDAYRARPDGAAMSMKKSQRKADAVRDLIKKAKKKATWVKKQKQEEQDAKLREKLYDRLRANVLPPGQRDELMGSTQIRITTKQLPHKSTHDPPPPLPEQPPPPAQPNNKRSNHKKPVQPSATTHDNNIISTVHTIHDDSDDSDNSSTSSSSPIIRKPQEVSVNNPFTSRPAPVSHKRPTTHRPRALSSSSSTTSSVDSFLAPVPMPTTAPHTILSVTPTHRPVDVIESRSQLPVCGMEQEILEAVWANNVIFLTGETGSGKTTQIPQMLLEAGFGCTQEKSMYGGMIAVVEPRRVAAISTASRVAYELGTSLSARGGNRTGVDGSALQGCVGYQVRHDAHTIHENQTRIKFMTDGILLQEAREDLLLRKYSAVLLDEAHERGLNSDLLLGLLSRIVPLRQAMHDRGEISTGPLKLIVMSATRSVEELVTNHALFPRVTPPIIRVEARQHPVTPHFARKTDVDDYLHATLRMIRKIHKKLPPGGVLVFLTGQNEIEWMCRKLKEDGDGGDDDDRIDASVQMALAAMGEEEEEEDEDADATNHPMMTDDDNPSGPLPAPTTPIDPNTDNNFSDLDDTSSDEDERPPLREISLTMNIIPLFSRLSRTQQAKVFQPTPPGTRLIVVATNVAETSITIPGIRYVVDSGREKRREYNQATGASVFTVGWVSKSSADQRMGRAGRTMPGHCYRVYSAAVYMNQMRDKNEPEIFRVSIDDLVLYMKAMGIDHVSDFPFPTPPSLPALKSSERRLVYLGALESYKQSSLGNHHNRVTELGKLMSRIPLSCRLAKTLVMAARDVKFRRLLPHMAVMTAAASLMSPFFFSVANDDEGDGHNTTGQPPRRPFAEIRRIFRGSGSSDLLALLRASGAYEHAVRTSTGKQLCTEMRLDEKIMQETTPLAMQVLGVMSKLMMTTTESRHEKNNSVQHTPIRLFPLVPVDEALICQVICSGFIDHVAKKLEPMAARTRAKSLGLPFPPRRVRDWPYETSDMEFRGEYLFIGSRSFMCTDDTVELPDYVVYQHVNGDGMMEGITEIKSSWLPALAAGTGLVVFGSPCDEPPPTFDMVEDVVKCTYRPVFGPKAWSLPLARMAMQQHDGGDVLYAWFARFLLEGKVVGKLGDELLAAPAQITRAPHFPNVMALVNALTHAQVACGKALREKIANDSTFLIKEIKLWVKGFNEWPSSVLMKKRVKVME